MNMKTETPLLTISILISNRPDTVPRCLDSLKPIMDRIPSELILIDTSKSEEIHNLLLTYTDKVYEFEWCKDFAKARNEGVRRAKGQWFMFLDDDEWFVETEDIINFFCTGKYKNYTYANISIRNFTNVEYTLYSDGWCTRLFYLGNGAKFVGKVHEYPDPISGEPAFLQGKAYHSGYVYETEEKRQKHFERNHQLLLEMLKAEPGNLKTLAQLAQEYHTVSDWESMVALCKQEITKVKALSTCSDQNNFCTLYAGLVDGLTHLKRNKKAIEVCEVGLEDNRSTDLLKFFLRFYLAKNYFDLKKWSKAKKYIEQYFNGYEYFQKNKENMNLQLGALLVHRIFDTDYIEIAAEMLVVASLKKENIEVPIAMDEEETNTQIDGKSICEFVKGVVRLIASTEHKKIFVNFLNKMVQNEMFCKLICAEVLELEKEDEEAFRKVAGELSHVDSNFWYICYCRVIEADVRGDKESVETMMETLLKELSIVCYMPDRVYEIIDKYDIKIALLWDKVVGEQWPVHVKHLVNNCEDVYIDKAYDYLLDVYKEDDWRVTELVSAFQEKMLVKQRQEEMQALRVQVLEQVKVLKEAGREQEAEQILAQLSQILPENES